MQPHTAHITGAIDGFLPHGHCYLWNQPLLLTHLVSDVLIGASYVVISLALATLVYRARRDIPFRAIFVALGLVIVAGGLTHFMEVWTIWRPDYWLSGGVKVVTAIASVATAAVMPVMVPRIHSTIRGARGSRDRELAAARAAALEEQNALLTAQTAELERQRAEARALAAELVRANAELRRVAGEAQRHLDELEATYRSAPVGLCVVDADLRFVRINERLASMNGRSAEAHIGHTVREIVPTVADQVEPILRQVIETGEPLLDVEISGETHTEPGVLRHWIQSWHPLRNRAGEIVGINVVVEDVTERHRAEAALLASEARYRALVEAVPLAAWSSRPDGRIDLVNRRWAEFSGETADALVGRPWSDIVHPEDREQVHHLREHANRTGEPMELEVRFRRGDGIHRWHLVRLVPVAARGSVFAWYGGAVDIDDRRREATELAATIAELRGANAQLERLTEDLRFTNDELAAASAEASAARILAEQASAAKSAFLATMSHELRTPLNAVLGYVELLALGVVGEVTLAQRGYLDRVTASAKHLLGLINEVLDLTKVEAGQMTIELQPTPLRDQIRHALTLVRPQAEARHLDLLVDTPPATELTALADPGRVRQIIVNLLGNAVRFTEPGGRITIRVARAGRADGGVPPTLRGGGPWLRVDVHDTGIGIPAHRLEAVFDPFVQIAGDTENVYTRQHGGAGLGLTIARRLARLMGGDLTGDSVEGVGSTFTLWLTPLGRDATAVARSARSEVGRVLGAQAVPVVAAVAERMRTDPLIPAARDAAQVDLEVHMTAFLAELGQELTILDALDGDRVQLLADGFAVQRLLVEKHGRLRVRLGWDERSLRREFELLQEEVERAVRAHAQPTAEAPVDDLLALVRALVDEAARIALGTLPSASEAR